MSSPDERNVKRARKLLPFLQLLSALQLADGVCVIATSEKFPSPQPDTPSNITNKQESFVISRFTPVSFSLEQL